MTGEDLAQAAIKLVGAPFRLHGRDPASGLDCIGVLSAAMASAGRPVPLPNLYSLRSAAVPELERVAAICGFTPTQSPPEPGDVIFVRTGPCQYHLLLTLDRTRFVHAHAGLRRVAIASGPIAWPCIGHWRLTA